MDENIKKQELDFLYDEDLLPVLEKLGFKEDFLAGKLKCAICGDVITNENLYSFFNDKEIKVSCNKETCKNKAQKNGE